MQALNRLSYMDIKQLGTTGTPSVDSKRAEQRAPIEREPSPQPTGKQDVARTQPPELELSAEAKTLQKAIASASTQPAVDQNRVERLRALVNSGQYPIDAQSLAKKIIQFEQQFKDR